MNLYIGNLSYETTDHDLREAFSAFGQVTSASVIMDRESGRSRGFGFVEMSSDTEGNAAIQGMNEKSLNGRALSVNQARPSNANRGGGSGGRQNYR